ncbi:MAG: Ig-like domain-containing protein, partial [Actinomycetota bacterium]|nr:Ig-like domain-containing protein [Actinomycetota bacterium]
MRRIFVPVLAMLLAFSAMIAGPEPSTAVVPGGIGRIAFSSTMDHIAGEIYVRDFSGGTPVRLTNNAVSDDDPAWSPDGSKIAFTSSRDGNDEVYTMSTDGKSPIRLTNDVAADYDPAWSPDGSKIAFTSARTGSAQVFVMNSDGTAEANLSNHIDRDMDPSWSPDGSKIAFTSKRDGDYEIYVMNHDGTNQVNLTTHSNDDHDPVWSPDGSKIAFASERDGNYEVYVMNADGTNQKRLTNDISFDRDPAWSPDGSKIAFASTRDGFDWDIFMMNPDGSDVGHLTNNPAQERQVDWEAVNRPPVARNDTASVHMGESVMITVTGNDTDPDGDPVSLEAIVTPPTHGTLSNRTWASVDYTHDGSASTTDTFTYRINDTVLTDIATVTITITNHPPVAVDDTATVAQGGSVTIKVLTNDADPDGDAVTLDGVVTPPAHGTLSTLTASSLVYSHDGSASTTDTFTYRIADGVLTDTATVSITVTSSGPAHPRFV